MKAKDHIGNTLRSGDIIKITHPSYQYLLLDNWANKYKFDFSHGEWVNNEGFNKYKICLIKPHVSKYRNEILAGIENIRSHKKYIIDVRGLQLVKKGSILILKKIQEKINKEVYV